MFAVSQTSIHAVSALQEESVIVAWTTDCCCGQATGTNSDDKRKAAARCCSYTGNLPSTRAAAAVASLSCDFLLVRRQWLQAKVEVFGQTQAKS